MSLNHDWINIKFPSFSPSGAKYRGNFNFMNQLVCGEAASDVLVIPDSQLTNRKYSHVAAFFH